MVASADIAPLAGTVGGGFSGYAIKKVIKLAAVIIGLFIATLAYFEYEHVINVDWSKVQGISQNGITWITNAIANISNTLGSPYSGTLSHIIPLASIASACLMLGLAYPVQAL